MLITSLIFVVLCADAFSWMTSKDGLATSGSVSASSFAPREGVSWPDGSFSCSSSPPAAITASETDFECPESVIAGETVSLE